MTQIATNLPRMFSFAWVIITTSDGEYLGTKSYFSLAYDEQNRRQYHYAKYSDINSNLVPPLYLRKFLRN